MHRDEVEGHSGSRVFEIDHPSGQTRPESGTPYGLQARFTPPHLRAGRPPFALLQDEPGESLITECPFDVEAAEALGSWLLARVADYRRETMGDPDPVEHAIAALDADERAVLLQEPDARGDLFRMCERRFEALVRLQERGLIEGRADRRRRWCRTPLGDRVAAALRRRRAA